jgi:hypothetical protein
MTIGKIRSYLAVKFVKGSNNIDINIQEADLHRIASSKSAGKAEFCY